jgi:hypothetical protein
MGHGSRTEDGRIGFLRDQEFYLIIREDVLLEPGFDARQALAIAHELEAQYDESEREYMEEFRSRPIPGPRVVPPRPCSVYRYFDATGRLLYVGKTSNATGERKAHTKRAWWIAVDPLRTTIEWFDSDKAALDAEDVAIKTERPLYNRAGLPNE